MSQLELKRHRCFKIPREKLNLFLVALDVNFSDSISRHSMDCVFIAQDSNYYDVIVAQYGDYLINEKNLQEFVENL